MTFEEYLGQVDTAYHAETLWRRGQAAFNVLHQVRPELADAVRGRTLDLDPFVIDDNLERFYGFVHANWDPLPGPAPAQA